jgi:membrane protease YdiL (CAAX protease family)
MKPEDTPSPMSPLHWAWVLIVFVPIILTSFIPVLARPLTSPIIAAYPAFPFVLYAFWSWALIMIGHFILKRLDIGWKDIGVGSFRWRDLGWAVLAAIIAIFIVYPLTNVILTWLGLGALQGRGLSVAGPLNLISAILFPSLLIPVAEEVLFRGFLIELLTARLHRKWIAGLVSGFMFWLIHIPLFGWSGMLLYVLLWTPLPVVLYLWRKSLWPSSIMHVLNNTFGFVVASLLTRA